MDVNDAGPAEPAHRHPHPDHGHSEHGDPLDAAHALAHADVWLSDVTAGYRDPLALEHVTVAVGPRGLLAVVGADGAGKSTLLKLIAGAGGAGVWAGLSALPRP